MISLKDVHLSIDGKPVLKGLSLDIYEGETMIIMGRSGCGKTVTLKVILGLLKPDSGEVWVDGKEITKLDQDELNEVRKKIGVLFQSSALFDSLTVGENVAFMLNQHTDLPKEEIKKIVAEKLALVGMAGTEDMKPAQLSGGMRKRVGLARAIAMNPKIILYDEPTTALDPITVSGILRLIKGLHDKLGVTSVIVTHDIPSAFFLGSRIAMMHDGRIIEVGSPEEIKRSENPFVKAFLSGEPDAGEEMV
ncbi:ABC transporter ATP-binding protein [Candidatus Poribacteria bacterium]|nr:MAG: ABC transporter ATP-binding protein [Candidatus Poribacteria bacterium]